jgi:hypothetical protein
MFYVQKLSFKNRAVCEIMSKILVELEKPQMTSQYGAYELDAGLVKLHARTCIHTPTIPGARNRARAHTFTNIQYLFLFYGNNDPQTCLIVTSQVNCLCCYDLGGITT